MVEKKILVDDLRLEYSGIFEVNELYKLFDAIIFERNYMKFEKKSEEIVTKTGKTITLELRPTKEFELDYLAYIKIRARMNDVKKITLEIDGIRRAFDQGNILIIFDGW